MEQVLELVFKTAEGDTKVITKPKKAVRNRTAFTNLLSHSHLGQEVNAIQRFIRLEHYKFIKDSFQFHQIPTLD